MSIEQGSGCPNCGAAGVQSFCPVCGQAVVPPDRSLLRWLKGAFDELLSLDGRTIRTLRDLFASPGKLTVAWVEGDRTRYTPPFRLYLVSSLLFFGVLSALGTSPVPFIEFLVGLNGMEQEEHIRAIAAANPGPWPPELLRAAAGVFHGLIEDAITVALVIVVPATALILQLLFVRAKRWYYADHVIHVLHVASAALLAGAVVWPFLFIEDLRVRWALAGTLVFGLLAYGAISFARVYGLGLVRTAIAYPAMLVLGAVGGQAIFGVTVGEARAYGRVDASLVFWEEAYARYAERVYLATVTPGRSAEEREGLFNLSEVVYQHAPASLRRLDAHLVSDFAEVRLMRGDGGGALPLFALTLRGLRRPLDGVGGSAAAFYQLGDSVRAREMGREFLAMLDGGARGFHPERTNQYRLIALEILGPEPAADR